MLLNNVILFVLVESYVFSKMETFQPFAVMSESGQVKALCTCAW